MVAEQIRASALAGQNKIEESIAALEDAHKAAPDAATAGARTCLGLRETGQAGQGRLRCCRTLSNKFPTNAQILVFLGQAKIAEKKNDEAAQSFKKAIAQQPKEPAGYTALTELLHSKQGL